MTNPNEIAALTVFLCYDEAKGITMEDITIAAGAICTVRFIAVAL